MPDSKQTLSGHEVHNRTITPSSPWAMEWWRDDDGTMVQRRQCDVAMCNEDDAMKWQCDGHDAIWYDSVIPRWYGSDDAKR